jgi:hypothetical protein
VVLVEELKLVVILLEVVTLLQSLHLKEIMVVQVDQALKVLEAVVVLVV